MMKVNSQAQRSLSGFPSSGLQARKDLNELLAKDRSGPWQTQALGGSLRERVVVQ